MPSANDITELDLVIGYRDDAPCIVTLTDENGVARDLGTNTYEMHVSNQRFPTTETPSVPTLIFWDITPTIVAPATNGQIQFVIPDANWGDLVVADFNQGGKQRMYYDIVELATVNVRQTILEGKLTIQRTVRVSD